MKSIKNLNLNFKIENCILIAILIIIFVTTTLISFNTKLNAHPDEKVHYDAIKYYKTHNLPPKFTSEEIIDTFSVHGESRLTELDAYYFFNGKYTNILNLFSNNDIFNARSFNLILLAIILILCYKLYSNKNYLFMPFLLTSQLWYIFAYINNDAWAIFLNMIFIYQLFFKGSSFHALIESTKKDILANKIQSVTRFALLGLLFYFLLITKINYLIATGFSAILYLIINRKKCFKKENLVKIGIILLIGLLFFSIRMLIDLKINGLDRLTNMEEIRLSRASDGYKPPYTAQGFKLKEKGNSINSVIANKSFYTQIIKSFFGVYGYLDTYSPNLFYIIIFICYIIFLSYITITNIKDRKEKEIWPLILFFVSGIIVFAFSVYRSYTYDFQAQGRYLLPTLPLLCAIMHNQNKNKILDFIFFIMATILIVMYFKYGYCALIKI